MGQQNAGQAIDIEPRKAGRIERIGDDAVAPPDGDDGERPDEDGQSLGQEEEPQDRSPARKARPVKRDRERNGAEDGEKSGERRLFEREEDDTANIAVPETLPERQARARRQNEHEKAAGEKAGKTHGCRDAADKTQVPIRRDLHEASNRKGLTGRALPAIRGSIRAGSSRPSRGRCKGACPPL